MVSEFEFSECEKLLRERMYVVCEKLLVLVLSDAWMSNNKRRVVKYE